jgi:hypothetical protein
MKSRFRCGSVFLIQENRKIILTGRKSCTTIWDMNRKFKLSVSVSSTLLNTLLASSLFATTYASDINPGSLPFSGPGFNLGNSLLIGAPNPLPGLVLESNPNPLPQAASVRKSRQK